MSEGHIPETWVTTLEGKTWKVMDEDGKLIATIAHSVNADARAKLVAASPYMLEALKAMVELIGDEDLPDNGELSGGAICDLVRAAVSLATV